MTIRLPYGCNRGVPDTVTLAWGARLIAPDDLLYDRQGIDGDPDHGERDRLLSWLGHGAGDAARARAREIGLGVGDSGSSDEIVTLYEDEHGIVVGSPQRSYGYCYISAWLHAHDTARGLPGPTLPYPSRTAPAPPDDPDRDAGPTPIGPTSSNRRST